MGNITGGWDDSYTTNPGSGVLEIFDEHIVQTAGPAGLSSTLASLAKAGNSTLSYGTAGSMNYSYSMGKILGNKNILMIGYEGGYVVDLSIIIPANSSVAPVNAIAQQVSASLG
jgi:hypothetical protein